MQTLLEAERAQDAERLTQFSEWIFAETAGQPLFLTETLKALVDNGFVQPNRTTARWQLDGAKFEAEVRDRDGHITPGIQQIIKGWLARISPSANKLLATAAVLTQACTFDQLCAVAGVEEIEALNTLDELLAKQPRWR
jgi:predicted ATPase